MNTDTQIAKVSNQDLSLSGAGIDIEGLEDVSASIIPIPWLKLVQPTSQNVETVDGTDAPVGSFYYSDTKESLESVKFALLKAKQGTMEAERNGRMEIVPKIAILGYDLVNDRKFVLSLSITSFSPFGSLVARFKQNKITNTYSHAITVSSEKTQNAKGQKYFIVKFDLGEQLPDEKIAELAEMKAAFGVVLNRQAPEEVRESLPIDTSAQEAAFQEEPTQPTGDENVDSDGLPF